MIILGIDPSLRGTGWGVLESDNNRVSAIAWGVVRNPPKVRPSHCLLKIHTTLTEIIKEYRPVVLAIEGLFYAQNIQTTLTMGQARGAALLVAAQSGLEIFEYAPRRVKQSVTGAGKAAKNQVGFMVRALLALKETPEPDAADALAVALTHLNHRNPGIQITPL